MNSPAILNKSAEGEGWIAELEVADFSKETSKLLDKAKYDKYCAEH